MAQNGMIDTIVPPEGHTFDDLESIATPTWSGLVVLTSHLGSGMSKLQSWSFRT